MQDFGRGWTNLTANSGGAIASFRDFDWGANIHRNEKTPPDETILATVYESVDAMKGLMPDWDKDIHFVSSSDFFKSAHTKLVSCGNQFELIGHKVARSVELHFQAYCCVTQVVVARGTVERLRSALMVATGVPGPACKLPYGARRVCKNCHSFLRALLSHPVRLG